MTAADAKAQLIRAAIDHLARYGADGQSLRAIAAGIGTSHRMLIYHFGSREGLLTAVVQGLWVGLQSELASLIDNAVEPDVRELGWRFWTTVVDAQQLAPIFFELSAPAMRGAPWTDSFQEGSAAWTAQVAALLESAGEPAERARTVARFSMDVVRGALWEAAITGDRPAADRSVRMLLDDHWPGIRPGGG